MSYTICIDGGGSKTLMQVLDSSGQVLSFDPKQKSTEFVGPSSNINSVGADGVRSALQFLFKDSPIEALIPRCRIVAGMAGVGIPQNKAQVRELFKEWGVQDENLYVMSDIDTALAIVEGDGVALICGTGSIAKGKKGERVFRAGGLGPILGDEGSAHKIGLALIQAITAEEYRVDTDKERIFDPEVASLKAVIKNCDVPAFQVDEIRTLIPRLKEIPPAEFALLSPIVFEEAHRENRQAIRIVKEAAIALNHILKDLEEQGDLKEYALDLHGGVFKGPYADLFIRQIREVEPRIQAKTIQNKSAINPIVTFGRNLIKGYNHSRI